MIITAVDLGRRSLRRLLAGVCRVACTMFGIRRLKNSLDYTIGHMVLLKADFALEVVLFFTTWSSVLNCSGGKQFNAIFVG